MSGEPVVTMTAVEYFTRWLTVFACVTPLLFGVLYVVIRYAVRWGIREGMDQFLEQEKR